jgi:NAD-dependent dihydropyrimidine dehydrogenase PreA subunit
MSGANGGIVRVVIQEGGSGAPLDAAERHDLVRGLLEKGYPVSCVGSSAAAPPATGTTLVLGRFAGRAAPEEGETLKVRDLDSMEDAGLAALLDEVREGIGQARPGAWKPWFPVIDYQRCTNCMQCLSFCLFDVYGVSAEGKIQVRNQSNCKTECPACSRVCPEVAIMFPKYRHGPINGDEVSADDVRREAMKVDISALLGGDIYAALRDRSAKAKSRFSKERSEDRALEERQNCLIKLRQSLDVPPEVLASLPTADEIRARAEAAQEAARRALAAQAKP